MKKLFSILLTALILITPLFAQGAMESSASVNETVVFTDDLGREITVPSEITRIAPSGNTAQVILLTFEPDLMAGMAGKLSGDGYSYLPESVQSLPVLGAFYGKKANLNKEALIVADPQVVVDIGEIKGSVEAMAKDLDVLTEQTGIPTVFVENYLKDSGHTYRKLGSLLGLEERAEELATYADEAIAFAERVKAEGNGERSFYYSSSADGLEGIPTGSFHGEVLEGVGGRNVVDKTFSSGNNQISLEQILLLNPDVIFLGNSEAYKVVTDPTGPWASLDAVKNGEVYVVPRNIYSWIDSPPSINRLLGIYYAAEILYPEIANVDIKAEAKRYFKLFYGVDLPDEKIVY